MNAKDHRRNLKSRTAHRNRMSFGGTVTLPRASPKRKWKSWSMLGNIERNLLKWQMFFLLFGEAPKTLTPGDVLTA
jgi:hypothetical protein